MGTLIFDFETDDKDLTTKGPGWVFGTCEIIGMGFEYECSNLVWPFPNSDVYSFESGYTTCKKKMVELLTNADTWVAHNLPYELGIAKYILGVEFKDKIVRDTLVGAYLEDNRRLSFSLEALAKEIGKEKDQERFGRYVLEKGLFKPRHIKTDPDGIKSATKWAMRNLNLLSVECPELIEEYCKSDVEITRELDQKYCLQDKKLYEYFSEAQKVCVEMRAKGVRIDEQKIFEVDKELTKLIEEQEDILATLADPTLNYRSSQQLAEAFDTLGLFYPVTDKGNPNIDTKVLLATDHPYAKAVYLAKKYTKARDDFCRKLTTFLHKGRIHGEMTLFGARDTGRFSHKLPNLAQIPARDDITGPLIRSLFIADEGEQWHSLDFSAQEPRLMVHYGVLCEKAKVKYEVPGWVAKKEGVRETKRIFNDPSIYKLQCQYRLTPQLDSHNYNKNIIKKITGLDIERKDVKTIALGKAYGMGAEKLADSLKLDKETTEKLIEAFYKGAPYLKQLEQYCQFVYTKNKAIKLLSGRTLKNDGFPHKAMNKKIQGSAADQVIAVILRLYAKDIIPSIVVHDEVNISGTLLQAEVVKTTMETAVSLEIPSYADLSSGQSWAEAKYKEK